MSAFRCQKSGAASSALLAIGLAACGPSQADIQSCKAAPEIRNQQLRNVTDAFYRTDVGRKYKAVTAHQIAAHPNDYPGLKDMEAIYVFNAQIEGIERRYRSARKSCAEKGL